MGKLKPKYLFASAALLILLVVVVYVVTRSKDPKDPIPNSPSVGSDNVARILDFGTPGTPGTPDIGPVTAQRTLTYDDGSTPEITQALADLFDEDIRPVTAQLASPFELTPEVAPDRPTLQDVIENYDVIDVLGDRVEHINRVLNRRIDDVIDVLGDGLQKVNQSVEYCHDRVWRLEDQLRGETAEIGDDNLIEY